MIYAISNNLAAYLGKKLNSSHDNIEMYAYGMQILLGAIIKGFGIVGLAWLLNTLNTTLVLFLVFAAFRCFGGGAHLNTYSRCLIFGVSIIVGLGFLSQIYLSTITLDILFALSFIFAIYTCVKFAPADTEKKPISDEKIRLRQKKKLLLVIVIWSCTIIYLLKIDRNIFTLAMILGGLSSLLLITPLGYQLLALIDKLAAKGGETIV
jgi:accessory gene regulator B